MRTLRRVAVLGPPETGSRIAAHFAAAGVSVSPLAQPDPAEIERCDWIIAAHDTLDSARRFIEAALPFLHPGAFLSSASPVLPVASLLDGVPHALRRAFLATHFFGARLLELVPAPETDPAIPAFLSEFAAVRLGLSVVHAQDTPGFIAARTGAFLFATAARLMVDGDYTVEEADALTGPLIGAPPAATFHRLDATGLDAFARTSRALHSLLPHDPWRDRFLLQPFQEEMLSRNWLGDKSGRGFYQSAGLGEPPLALDWKALEYRAPRALNLPGFDAARSIDGLPERLRYLVRARGRAGAFLSSLLGDLFLYLAGRLPEISGRIVEIDRAVRWGYAFQLGPFQLWDALGVEETVNRMRQDGRTIPAEIERMLEAGGVAFYAPADEEGRPHTVYYDFPANGYVLLDPTPGVLHLPELKRARGLLRGNSGFSLADIGDGVLCLEFHARSGAIAEDQIEALLNAIEECERSFDALILTASGYAFSTGADFAFLLRASEQGAWDEIDAAIRRDQKAALALQRSARPTVAAIFGPTLGLGCELALHAARIQAAADVIMGFNAVAAGLIPAAGGAKELLARCPDPRRVMELLFPGRTASSASDACFLGLLSAADGVTINPDRLLADAKAAALSLVPGWTPRPPRSAIRVSGDPGYALLKMEAWLDHRAHRTSDYDFHIAGKLAYVLSGGRLTGERHVPEQYLLDLEREAFLSLCGQPKTQERIRALLQSRSETR